MAMYLLENWPGIEEWDVEIIPRTSIPAFCAARAPDATRPARCNMFPSPGCRSISRAWATSIRFATICARQSEFTRVNLAEPADTRGYRNFDVIFCRNLLIYFDDASRKTAAETFYEALNPGGYLCLGHSESMSRISSLFEVRKFPEAIVYRKSLEAK